MSDERSEEVRSIEVEERQGSKELAHVIQSTDRDRVLQIVAGQHFIHEARLLKHLGVPVSSHSHTPDYIQQRFRCLQMENLFSHQGKLPLIKIMQFVKVGLLSNGRGRQPLQLRNDQQRFKPLVSRSHLNHVSIELLYEHAKLLLGEGELQLSGVLHEVCDHSAHF